MKTITATLNDDGTLLYKGRTFKAEARPKIEVGTQYEFWYSNGWYTASWAGGRTDRFYKANDLLALTPADKERIEKRQAALLAADAWFDENGRFEPDWDDKGQQKWFVWANGTLGSYTAIHPLGVPYFFDSRIDAEKFVEDMGDHLKWL